MRMGIFNSILYLHLIHHHQPQLLILTHCTDTDKLICLLKKSSKTLFKVSNLLHLLFTAASEVDYKVCLLCCAVLKHTVFFLFISKPLQANCVQLKKKQFIFLSNTFCFVLFCFMLLFQLPLCAVVVLLLLLFLLPLLCHVCLAII